METKTIEKIELYVDNELIATYERLSRFQVNRGTSRKPYNDVVVELPGTIKA